MFILLLLAILTRVGKRKGQVCHRSLASNFRYSEASGAKHNPPSVSYKCPQGTTPWYELQKMNSSGSGRGRSPHRRLAIRLLFRPIPRHFSKWGAKREAAMLRLQLGQTHSLLFHWLKTCPKMSNPGWSTISGGRRGVAIRAGRGHSPLVPTHGPMASSNPLPKLTGAPGSTSAVVSREGTSRH